MYNNLKDREVKFNGRTSVVQYPTDGDKIGDHIDLFLSWDTYTDREAAHLWSATNFRWRMGSEHTVDEKRFDLELQVMHTPVYKREDEDGKEINRVKRMGLAVFFDSSPELRDSFDKEELEVIDDMFDSMNWAVTDKEPKVKSILMGNFLQFIVNMEDRWVYEGS
jgi:hypothetical protein